MSDHTLDARGLLCPLPVIRTQNKIKSLAGGDILEVMCTDPGVIYDIPAWCRIHGHEVLEVRQQEHDIFVRIKVLFNSIA